MIFFEQLQAIGIEVTATVPPRNDESATRPEHAPPPFKPDIADVPLSRPPRADTPAPEALMTILAAAKKVGVNFMERVTDGELMVEGLDHLAPDDHQKLQTNGRMFAMSFCLIAPRLPPAIFWPSSALS